MSSISELGDFLRYEPDHKVLICKDCQYAIQKSALKSHLLKHKIYRGQRQRLLSSISKLDLLEPEHIQLPSPTSAPIQHLPVLSGYRCASSCHTLCASEKRMKRHWKESHDTIVNGVLDETFAYMVHLQTFFRGTKLRYFEVRLPNESTPTRVLPDENISQPRTDGNRNQQETNDSQRDSNESRLSSLPPALAERLRTLPFRMAAALPRPDSPADFFATVSSLNSLIQCISLSYLSEDPKAQWEAMARWFQIVPERFTKILQRYPPDPAALVVLAHWTVLVQRAESHYWFFMGSAERLMREIKGGLPQDDAVQGLIAGLLS